VITEHFWQEWEITVSLLHSYKLLWMNA